MPTYEHECPSCGHRFELFLPMSADAKQPCPACGGRANRLLGTGAGVVVHGPRGVHANGRAPACGRLRPCCGRDERCDTPRCGSD